jgi:ribonucleotide monophosphatase NagD (HAD superfamily)
MIMHKIEELGLDPARCAMVGDRLYTDMEMAIRAGCVSVLVLSGEATLADLDSSGKSVDVVVNSVDELLR